MTPAAADTGATQPGENGLRRLLDRCVAPQKQQYGLPMKPGPDGRNILRTLLEEVDETMLPRALTLKCDPVGSVRVIASNRRLVAAEFTDNEQKVPPLSPSRPAEMAKTYASTLSAFFSRCSEVRLLPPERVTEAIRTDCSCSALLVIEAAMLEGFGPGSTGSFDNFCATQQEVASAWVRFDRNQEKRGSGGADDLTGQLEHIFRRFKDPATAASKNMFRTSGPECVIVPFPGKQSLIACSDRDEWFLALIPADQTDKLSIDWHSGQG